MFGDVYVYESSTLKEGYASHGQMADKTKQRKKNTINANLRSWIPPLGWTDPRTTGKSAPWTLANCNEGEKHENKNKARHHTTKQAEGRTEARGGEGKTYFKWP